MRTVRLAYRDTDRTSAIYCIKPMAERRYGVEAQVIQIEQFDLTTKVTKSTKFKSKNIEPLRVLRALVVNPSFSFLVAALPRYAFCG